MLTFAPHTIKSAPSLLIHANMDFNNMGELPLDSNVHLSTPITQISTFEEQINTYTMIEHLQGPNSWCAPPPLFQTSCASARRLQCFKWALEHLQSSKSALVHINAPHQLVYTSKARIQLLRTSNTPKTSSKLICNQNSTLATHMSGPITYWCQKNKRSSYTMQCYTQGSTHTMIGVRYGLLLKASIYTTT